jgi:hypothetical protein
MNIEHTRNKRLKQKIRILQEEKNSEIDEERKNKIQDQIENLRSWMKK